ncbi:MAG: hypothetical protein NC210_02080 [[Clostridium] fimetarium]|nr:hypothetical protein [Alistipes timonensis]MCM1405188.1 hypothetical protein [[Clostridium] fimetarium]
MLKSLITGTIAGAALVAAIPATAGAIFTPSGLGQSGGLKFDNNKSALLQRPSKTKGYSLKAVDSNGVMTPDFTMSSEYNTSSNNTGFLIGPDGTEWLYVIEPEYRNISAPGATFVDRDYTGFKINVYDGDMNLVGQASGTIEHPEGTKRCNEITVGTQATTQFFNSNNSDVEIMVIASFNPEKGYGSKSVTQVYSLKAEGEKTPCLFTTPGSYVVAMNASNTASENYWFAFFDESTWTEDLAIDKNTGKQKYEPKFSIFRKAGWGTPPSNVLDIPFEELYVASDGENDQVLPLIMNVKGSEVYIATWRYEKTFFLNPTDPSDDRLSPDNNFMIDLYKGDTRSFDKVKTTKIPVSDPDGDYMMRSYGLGMFFGATDLTFDFETGTLPGYIIRVTDSDIQSHGTSSSYIVYDTDGKEVKSFGKESSGYTEMTRYKGLPQQVMFDMTSDKHGEAGLVIFDYPSMEETGFIPKLFVHEDDIWQLQQTPDRVKSRDGIFYVAPVQPTSGATSARVVDIAFFTADGELDHVDHLEVTNDGGKIAKINSFLSEGAVFDPYMIHTSKGQEYLHWIYRYIDEAASKTSVELAITDNKGNILASRMMPEGAQMPYCVPINLENNPKIVVRYPLNGDEIMEVIALPLNKFEGEGTAESPYLIKTVGDLEQVRNNLTSHFALANDILCEGREFRPIEGAFTGSFDGRGYEISGLSIESSKSGDAMFRVLGQRASFDADGEPIATEPAAIKNLTLYNPSFVSTATSGSMEHAIVANVVYNSKIENVRVINPSVEVPAGSRATMGIIAHTANNAEISGSAVLDANVSIPQATGLAGIANILAGGSVKASAFTGKLEAASGVAGIASQNRSEAAVIENCHVNAELVAQHTVGGIIATSSRSSVKNCLVEGKISATAPTTGYTEEDVYTTYNAGGIVGKLEAATYEDPDADDFLAVDKCVVALESITLSTEPDAADAIGAHRLIGWSSIDGGPVTEWVLDGGDESHPVIHPAEAEKRVGENFVLGSLAPVETAAEPIVTEGTTFDGTADKAWFTTKGYAFDGASAAAPWTFEAALPVLFYESSAAQALYFADAELTGTEGETLTVALVLRDIDPSTVTVTSSDATGASVEYADGEAAISLLKAGTYTITATSGAKTATTVVTVKEYVGIGEVEAEAASALRYNGTEVEAEGCAIAIFSVQGQQVAVGNNAISTETLLPGVYVAKAVAADGSVATLKFATK